MAAILEDQVDKTDTEPKVRGCWVLDGLALGCRCVPINDLSTRLGQEKTKGITLCHAFTGCDVVTTIREKGKR